MATVHGRGMIQDDRAGGRRRRPHHCGPRAAPRRHGRVPPARHARYPAARRVHLSRRVRRARVLVRVHRCVHEQDAHRRVPRCRAARGDVRDRAGRRRARPRDGHRPRRDPSAQLHPAGQVPVRDVCRVCCTTAGTTNPRSPARSRWSGTTTCGASKRHAVSAATRTTWASASRRTSRCAGSPRAGCSASSTSAPAVGSTPRCGSCRPGRWRWSPGPVRTGRATRPAGR